MRPSKFSYLQGLLPEEIAQSAADVDLQGRAVQARADTLSARAGDERRPIGLRQPNCTSGVMCLLGGFGCVEPPPFEVRGCDVGWNITVSVDVIAVGQCVQMGAVVLIRLVVVFRFRVLNRGVNLNSVHDAVHCERQVCGCTLRRLH